MGVIDEALRLAEAGEGAKRFAYFPGGGARALPGWTAGVPYPLAARPRDVVPLLPDHELGRLVHEAEASQDVATVRELLVLWDGIAEMKGEQPGCLTVTVPAGSAREGVEETNAVVEKTVADEVFVKILNALAQADFRAADVEETVKVMAPVLDAIRGAAVAGVRIEGAPIVAVPLSTTPSAAAARSSSSTAAAAPMNLNSLIKKKPTTASGPVVNQLGSSLIKRKAPSSSSSSTTEPTSTAAPANPAAATGLVLPPDVLERVIAIATPRTAPVAASRAIRTVFAPGTIHLAWLRRVAVRENASRGARPKWSNRSVPIRTDMGMYLSRRLQDNRAAAALAAAAAAQEDDGTDTTNVTAAQLTVPPHPFTRGLLERLVLDALKDAQQRGLDGSDGAVAAWIDHVASLKEAAGAAPEGAAAWHPLVMLLQAAMFLGLIGDLDLLEHLISSLAVRLGSFHPWTCRMIDLFHFSPEWNFKLTGHLLAWSNSQQQTNSGPAFPTLGLVPYFAARAVLQWDFAAVERFAKQPFGLDFRSILDHISSEPAAKLLELYSAEKHVRTEAILAQLRWLESRGWTICRATFPTCAELFFARKDLALMAEAFRMFDRASPALSDAARTKFERRLADRLNSTYVGVDELQRLEDAGLRSYPVLRQQLKDALRRCDRTMLGFAEEVLDPDRYQLDVTQALQAVRKFDELEPICLGLSLALAVNGSYDGYFRNDARNAGRILAAFPTMTQTLLSPPHSHDPAAIFFGLFSVATSCPSIPQSEAALHLAELTVYVLNHPEHHARALSLIGGDGRGVEDEHGDDVEAKAASFYVELLLLKHEWCAHAYSVADLDVTLHPDAPVGWTAWQFALHAILTSYPAALGRARYGTLGAPWRSCFATDGALHARLAAEAAQPDEYAQTMKTRTLLCKLLVMVDSQWVCDELLRLTAASPWWKTALVPARYRPVIAE
ncbi:hypothetical protein H9P43_005348 [Blastocladiella emersonii ATCC 22665]|nr:hypothetical protein H9P43_005348 [Blastocladiella emersonii ATCC 22665]